ncbi:hypothetical protein MMA231_03454 (plasmid) [Asticcacaulis sp. MM231]|uniref:class I SAM-dependent methyltransferase n=1 Tax=Asticcacaulis sp. MM231 TaxID=3157666 RepID=UPI0032D57FFF
MREPQAIGKQDHLDQPYSKLEKGARRARTESLIEAGCSDVKRWSLADNFHGNWRDRAQTVAAMIGAGDRVLDLGCGKMDLETALPAGCIYLPSDLVARDDRTLVCDLNAGELPAVEADVVTMLGVLEYIHDPSALLVSIAQRWSTLILTYNPSELDEGRDRLLHGWFNALTSAQLVAMAEVSGFGLVGIVAVDVRQRLYIFYRAGYWG